MYSYLNIVILVSVVDLVTRLPLERRGEGGEEGGGGEGEEEREGDMHRSQPSISLHETCNFT